MTNFPGWIFLPPLRPQSWWVGQVSSERLEKMVQAPFTLNRARKSACQPQPVVRYQDIKCHRAWWRDCNKRRRNNYLRLKIIVGNCLQPTISGAASRQKKSREQSLQQKHGRQVVKKKFSGHEIFFPVLQNCSHQHEQYFSVFPC